MTESDPRRFPIGPFQPEMILTSDERRKFVDELSRFPGELAQLVENFSPEQLGRSYREGGWTARQVIHHIPDSHLQGYVRFKLAITEDRPTIKTYDQSGWGALTDAQTAPTEVSLRLLDALHGRWAAFLRSLSEEDFRRSYIHPELGELTLDLTLQLYVWHGKHHLGHLKLVLEE